MVKERFNEDLPSEASEKDVENMPADPLLESEYIEENDHPVHQAYGHGYLGYNQGYQGYEGQSFQGYAAQGYQGYRDNESYVHIHFSRGKEPEEFGEDDFLEF